MDDDDVTTIHITKTLSSSMIMDLMDRYENLEEITCPPSIYNRTSKRYLDALEHLDISVTKKYKWGAESKSNDLEFYVKKLSDEGLTAKQISQKLDITLNRTYYLLRKGETEFNNRKSKHDHAKIKQLKEDGYSAKEISEELDIPIRTVYDILKEDKPALPPKKTANILTNAGAKKTTEKARNEFAKALANEGDKIAKRAIEIAHQEGKKTIKARHIQLALKE